ncbi:AAA family ATPase [Candidatus Sumerlaeota bacterium]|nr:AAA family ATPase [Candidatus Sumerlaeota bacterium]
MITPQHKISVLSARDFIAADRPPLVFHIQDVLPKGGKSTFSAPAKFGKSYLAMQLGLALASGNGEFLGWKFGPPARVLYFQGEIMDGLVEDRLKQLRDTMPEGMDRERALDNFFIQEIVHGAPNFQTRCDRIKQIIEEYKPEIIIVDPLCFCFPGLEENSSEKMGEALYLLTEIGIQYECAIILIHHHGKTGHGSRGSSIFEAWPDSDLSAERRGSEDVAIVTGRLRCAYGGGPWYWQMPTPDHPWFSSMPADYQPRSKGGRGRKGSVELVVSILRKVGQPMRPGELYAKYCEAADCKKPTAERATAEALKQGFIVKIGKLYALPSNSINPSNPSKRVLMGKQKDPKSITSPRPLGGDGLRDSPK